MFGLLLLFLSLCALVVVGICLLGALLPVRIAIGLDVRRGAPQARGSDAPPAERPWGGSACAERGAQGHPREDALTVVLHHGRFRLCTEVGEIQLTRAITVGRSSRCDVTLPDARVSRRHARLRVDRGAVMIEDLSSTNGTKVNGKPLRRTAHLREGDLVSFGGTVACRLERSGDTVALGN